jgi:site-specific DNA recombinase
LRTPMEKLDKIVVGEVARQVLDPVRLTAMLDAYVQSTAAQADGAKALLAKLRHSHTGAVAGIARLLELVEKGLMETEDPAMRERLVGLKLQRDQIAKEIGELQNRVASSSPTITSEKIARVGALLRDKLYEGPSEFRQAYARLLVEEVRVTDEEIRICGSKSVLARCASEGVADPAPRVLSFVQEWRARQDSNLWPLPSEDKGHKFPRVRQRLLLYDIALRIKGLTSDSVRHCVPPSITLSTATYQRNGRFSRPAAINTKLPHSYQRRADRRMLAVRGWGY